MRILIIACLGASLCGCPVGGSSDGEEQWTTGAYAFEVEYVNYSFGYQHFGAFVTSDGELWSYDIGSTGERWTTEESSPIPAEVLEDKFSHSAVLLEDLGPDAIAPHVERIDGAAGESLGDRANLRADAGRCQVRAYRYDPLQDEYQLVLLHEDGDWRQSREGEASQALEDWLVQLVSPYEIGEMFSNSSSPCWRGESA